MPRKIETAVKEDLAAIPAPKLFKGSVMSHQTIMDYMENLLKEADVSIQSESYRSTADGGIAQCVYKLEGNKCVAWINSYMPGARFKCGSGIYLTGDLYMIGDDEPAIDKKIPKDDRIKSEMKDVVANLDKVFTKTVEVLKEMKSVNIEHYYQGTLLGILYGSEKILTSGQAAHVVKNIKKDTTVSIAKFYTFVAESLKESHPKSWLDDHRAVYSSIDDFTENYKHEKEELHENHEKHVDAIKEIDPAQLNLIDQINEAEEKSLDTLESTEFKEEDEISISVDPIEDPIADERKAEWDQQTRIEEGLDHKGEFPETNEEDNEPVYDEDQITERVRLEEASEEENEDSPTYNPKTDEKNEDDLDFDLLTDENDEEIISDL